jgi:hypothetical protein
MDGCEPTVHHVGGDILSIRKFTSSKDLPVR